MISLIIFSVVFATVTSDTATLRLVDGNFPYEGRVEVFYSGKWGTVCDVWWDIADGEVVCNELGFGGALRTERYSYFGEGKGPIWIGDIDCDGYETSINECSIKWNGNYWCTDHRNDASVICDDVPPLQNIIRQRDSFPEPFLEILHDGEWGLICADAWNKNDADVACHMLGFGQSADLLSTVEISVQARRWMNNVLCTGKEKNIDECIHDGWGDYSCVDVASVSCNGSYSGPVCTGRVCDETSKYCCPATDDYFYCCAPMPPPTTITTTENLWSNPSILPTEITSKSPPTTTTGNSSSESNKPTDPIKTPSTGNAWWIALLSCVLIIAFMILSFCFYRECKRTNAVGSGEVTTTSQVSLDDGEDHRQISPQNERPDTPGGRSEDSDTLKTYPEGSFSHTVKTDDGVETQWSHGQKNAIGSDSLPGAIQSSPPSVKEYETEA